ncbi:MAG: hypothetical protein KAJ51_17775 [Thermoplasmata archaeon]|nr:hypothetical protein [Thermoplasmata archaeon]
MADKEEILLTKGSKYQITSLGSRDEPTVSTGTFIGYTAIGNVDGICLELDKVHKKLKGKVRIIPSHIILTIDIISMAEQDDSDDKEITERSYI